jgi:hypothetical protein
MGEAVQVEHAPQRGGRDLQRPGGGVHAGALGALGRPAGQAAALLVVACRRTGTAGAAAGKLPFGLGLPAQMPSRVGSAWA